ncbi:hypothetical protein PAPYR_7601 [Paratrimastix pyriformis]|uniref:Uncharacterized protein n=1 Tax=Paratrimastix pyriformis TaxID=342808 RepID=A0ABQ8UCU5_9EUKA|nr:hypothetical protein PAPYR_7601 [Paratrimastix pyriformis]
MMTGPPCFFTVPFLDSPEDCERYARVGLRYTPHMRLLLYPPGLPPAPAHQAPLSTAARLSMPSVGPITMSAVPHGLPLRGATWAEHLQPLRVTLDRLRDMYAKAGCLGPAALKAPGHAAGPSPLGAVWSVAVDGMWSPDVALQYLPYIEQPWPPQFFLESSSATSQWLPVRRLYQELHIRFVATESAAQPSTVARLRPFCDVVALNPALQGGYRASSKSPPLARSPTPPPPPPRRPSRAPRLFNRRPSGHPMRGILQRPAILMMGARTPGGSAAAAAAAGSTPAERFSDRSGFAFRYGRPLRRRHPAHGPPRAGHPAPGPPAQPGLVSTPVSITLPALPTITAPATPTLTSPPMSSPPRLKRPSPPPQCAGRLPNPVPESEGGAITPATAKPTPAPEKPRGPRLPPRNSRPPARLILRTASVRADIHRASSSSPDSDPPGYPRPPLALAFPNPNPNPTLIRPSRFHSPIALSRNTFHPRSSPRPDRLAALAAGIHPLVMPTTPSAVAPTPAFTAPPRPPRSRLPQLHHHPRIDPLPPSPRPPSAPSAPPPLPSLPPPTLVAPPPRSRPRFLLPLAPPQVPLSSKREHASL